MRLLLSASDYCRARGNEIVVHSSGNETVLGSSRGLGGPAEHLIDSSEKRICRSTFEFWSAHVIEKRSTFEMFVAITASIGESSKAKRYNV